MSVERSSHREDDSFNDDAPAGLQPAKDQPRYDFGMPNARGERNTPPVKRPKHHANSRFSSAATRKKVLAARGIGSPGSTAARYAGISVNTLWNWLDRGKLAGPESEGIEHEYYDFYIAYEQADATLEVGSLSDLIAIARGVDKDGMSTLPRDSQVLRWILEHLYPDKYGKHITVDGSVDHTHRHEHKGSVAVSVSTYDGLSDAKLDEMLATAQKLAASGSEKYIDAEVIED